MILEGLGMMVLYTFLDVFVIKTAAAEQKRKYLGPHRPLQRSITWLNFFLILFLGARFCCNGFLTVLALAEFFPFFKVMSFNTKLHHKNSNIDALSRGLSRRADM